MHDREQFHLPPGNAAVDQERLCHHTAVIRIAAMGRTRGLSPANSQQSSSGRALPTFLLLLDGCRQFAGNNPLVRRLIAGRFFQSIDWRRGGGR